MTAAAGQQKRRRSHRSRIRPAPTEIKKFVREDEQAYIRVEQISVLDAADVLIWGTEADADQAALEKVPGFSSLAAVKAGRSICTGGELSGAIYFTSPLSLPYVLDNLVPMLAGALARGGPAR